MHLKNTFENTKKNKAHYDKVYSDTNIERIVNKINNIDAFLQDVTNTDISWVCMYKDEFASQLQGKKVLELGCGDCTNAAVMAALGAEVWANDISEKSSEIIEKLNKHITFKYPIRFVLGNFLETEMLDNSFDIVVGKAFVHHLTHEQEEQFLKKIVKLLKPKGMVRYVEPAINSKLLDILRWMIPVSGRPSFFQYKKFKKWKLADPHPVRNNSGRHYKTIGLIFFEQVVIIPVGSIERLHRLFPKAIWNRKFRRISIKIEGYLPRILQYYFARTQTITYWFPVE